MEAISIGAKYGLLTILAECRIPKIRRGKPKDARGVVCKCDCGKEYTASWYPIKNGTVKSCGCYARKNKDLIGKKFGFLTFLEKVDIRNYRCKCDCGMIKTMDYCAIKSGRVVSCGCKRITHGLSQTRVYEIYNSMIQRVTNPNNISYKNYGERGIKICERWLASFENFYEDMGEPPTLHHSIERRDNDGQYEKGNCYWGTNKDQARNRRSNRLITFSGGTKCAFAWAEQYGIDGRVFLSRLSKGWKIEDALIRPKTQR